MKSIVKSKGADFSAPFLFYKRIVLIVEWLKYM